MSESPIRRGQLIHTFGVGALHITHDGINLIGAGLDYWYKKEDGADISNYDEFKVPEKRLAKRLNVDHFRLPPDYRFKKGYFSSTAENLFIKIPFLKFPTWHFCVNRRCSMMQKLTLADRRLKPKCQHKVKDDQNERKQCTGYLIQVPIVAICEKGHIQDFPWNEWTHRTISPKCSGENLKLFSTGNASIGGYQVHCLDCKKNRSLEGALGGEGKSITFKLGNKENALYCKGLKPWLSNEIGEPCSSELHGSYKSSNWIYYSKTSSSLYIPEKTSKARPEIIEILKDEKIHPIIDLLNTQSKQNNGQVNASQLRKIEQSNIKDRIARFNDEEIDFALAEILELENEQNDQKSPLIEFGSEEEEELYRRSEYELLLQENNFDKLTTLPLDVNSYDLIISKYFDSLTKVTRLTETTAFFGFSRVKFDNKQRLDEHKSKLMLEQNNFNESWLPAVQTSGEGFFLRIREEILKTWENKNAIINRVKTLQPNLDEKKIVIGPRKIFLHTLAHILINQLVEDCGYNAASLKERLYSSNNKDKPMSGILIYTSGGDSEGTMGGLVRISRPGYIEDIIRHALEKSSWCSVDPVCTEIGSTGGQGPYSCNLAACHNCALVPETSCEMFNSYLDRVMVTGHYKERSLGLMGDAVKTIK